MVLRSLGLFWTRARGAQSKERYSNFGAQSKYSLDHAQLSCRRMRRIPGPELGGLDLVERVMMQSRKRGMVVGPKDSVGGSAQVTACLHVPVAANLGSAGQPARFPDEARLIAVPLEM